MRDVTCDDVKDALQDIVPQGRPLPDAVRAHLAACEACREEARSLERLRRAMLHAAPDAAPPPELKSRVLQAARASNAHREPRRARGAWLVGAGLAAALSLSVWLPLRSGSAVASALRDPAVVVAVNDTLVVANNGREGARVAFVDARGRVVPVAAAAPNPAWFTEGLRVGDDVYLADAGNDRVLVVSVPERRVRDILAVPGGAAGLALHGGAVVCKTADGMLVELGGRERRLASAGNMPLADVMDAVVEKAGTLFVTHHARGEVYLLDPATFETRRVVRDLGAPVALAETPSGVLVLDHLGALIELNDRGDVVRRVRIAGRPDKLVLSDGAAFVSDRGGAVTRVDLATERLASRTFEKPMDLAVLSDGHVALADAAGGVLILDEDLDVMHTFK